MLKHRRSRPALASPLDSLLDTLFNFAGILIIVIILVQLNAGEAIKKLLPEDFAKLKQQEADLAAAQQGLNGIQQKADALAGEIPPVQQAADDKEAEAGAARQREQDARQEAVQVANDIPKLDAAEDELNEANQALAEKQRVAAAMEQKRNVARRIVQEENLKLLKLIAA